MRTGLLAVISALGLAAPAAAADVPQIDIRAALRLGPVWDFDLSAGNVTMPAAAPPEGWLLTRRPWAAALLADPGFRAALAQRWRALQARGFVRRLLPAIDRRARGLRAPARRNVARWPILGKPLFPA